MASGISSPSDDGCCLVWNQIGKKTTPSPEQRGHWSGQRGGMCPRTWGISQDLPDIPSRWVQQEKMRRVSLEAGLSDLQPSRHGAVLGPVHGRGGQMPGGGGSRQRKRGGRRKWGGKPVAEPEGPEESLTDWAGLRTKVPVSAATFLSTHTHTHTHFCATSLPISTPTHTHTPTLVGQPSTVWARPRAGGLQPETLAHPACGYHPSLLSPNTGRKDLCDSPAPGPSHCLRPALTPCAGRFGKLACHLRARWGTGFSALVSCASLGRGTPACCLGRSQPLPTERHSLPTFCQGPLPGRALEPWLLALEGKRKGRGRLAEMLAVRSPSLPAGPLLPDAGMSPDLSETQVSASERAWGGEDHATC